MIVMAKIEAIVCLPMHMCIEVFFMKQSFGDAWSDWKLAYWRGMFR